MNLTWIQSALSKQTCVVFISILGGVWLEAHFCSLLSLLMEWASRTRATQYPADALSCRCCVSFILRATLGTLLGEKAQIAAAKEICQVISKQKRVVGTKLGQYLDLLGLDIESWCIKCVPCFCQMPLFMKGTWRRVWALQILQPVSMCWCVPCWSWAVWYRIWAPLPLRCCRTPE